jgi:hypothetical protein
LDLIPQWVVEESMIFVDGCGFDIFSLRLSMIDEVFLYENNRWQEVRPGHTGMSRLLPIGNSIPAISLSAARISSCIPDV